MSLQALLESSQGNAASKPSAVAKPKATGGLSSLAATAVPNTNGPSKQQTSSTIVENPKGTGYPALNSDGKPFTNNFETTKSFYGTGGSSTTSTRSINPILVAKDAAVKAVQQAPRVSERTINPNKITEIMTREAKPVWDDAKVRIDEAIETWKNPQSTKVEKGAKIASAALGGVNGLLSGVTSLLKASEAVPGVGKVAHAVNSIFGAVGAGAGALAGTSVDNAPFSQKTKDAIKPVVEELASLAAQIALGKGGDIARRRFGDLTKKVTDHVGEEIGVPQKGLAGLMEQAQRTDESVVTPEVDTAQVMKDAKVKTVTEQMVEAPKKTDPLLEEAKKYKSAEEFIKSLGDRVQYRGGRDYGENNIVKLNKQNSGGLFFTSDKNYANAYARDKGGSMGGATYEVVLPENTKLFDINKEADWKQLEKILGKENTVQVRELINGSSIDGKPDWAEISQYSNELEEAGFDGFRAIERNTGGFQYPNGKFNEKPIESVALFKGDIPATKSLTDLYNQAKKDVEAQEKSTEGLARTLKPAESTGDKMQSRLASSVEAKAVEKKLTDTFGETPEYNRVNMKEQAELATKLLEEDPARARRIALGEELPPANILPESVFTALENRALKAGDVETLRDLATKSSLSTEATAMGQRIRALAERDPDSPVAKIGEVQKVRQKNAEKKGKTAKQAKKEEVAKIKKEIEKKAPTKQDWSSFIEEIKCNY